jgi:hypothetical protein
MKYSYPLLFYLLLTKLSFSIMMAVYTEHGHCENETALSTFSIPAATEM